MNSFATSAPIDRSDIEHWNTRVERSGSVSVLNKRQMPLIQTLTLSSAHCTLHSRVVIW